MKADFHIHTYFSDGTLSPEEVIDLAISKGLSHIAITDHDSISGIERALDYAKDKNITVLAGIELSCELNGEPIHVIGLFKDNIIPEGIKKYCQDVENNRVKRAFDMAKLVKEYFNLDMDLEYLKSLGGSITRAHLSRAIEMKNQGISKSLVWNVLSNDSKAYIPITHMKPSMGVELLHNSNSIAILAHPVLIKKTPLEIMWQTKFDGIEAIYPANKKGDEAMFRTIAKKHNYLISAASDFHTLNDSRHGNIGDFYITDLRIKRILKRLEE